MPKTITVRVTSMDAELEFAILESTTGKQLFDQVVKTIGLREIWFFGLQFVDSKGLVCWLKMNKKVIDQDIGKTTPLQFKFRVKFFPEEVTEELIQDITQRLFYLQVKDAILSGELYCPPKVAVQLAGLVMHIKRGDCPNDKAKQPARGFLAHERLLPSGMVEKYTLAPAAWEEHILEQYLVYRGMLREDAVSKYLEMAQELDMFGVDYYEITNKKGSELWLGVDATGLKVYPQDNKLTPKISFPWAEIRNISFTDKKFVIKPIDAKQPDFVFYSPRLRINKRILQLCMGNHELHMRRANPDTIEVQQMKVAAAEERKAKRDDRKRLFVEMQKRLDSEKLNASLQQSLARFEVDFKRQCDELARSEAKTQELIAKVRRAEEQSREREDSLRITEQELQRALAQIEQLVRESTDLAQSAALRAAAEVAQRSAGELQRAAQQSKAESSDLQRQLLETQQQQLLDSHALMSSTQVPLQLARDAAAMANLAVGGSDAAGGRRMSMSRLPSDGGAAGPGRHAQPDDDEVDVDGDLGDSVRSPGGASAKPRGVRPADDESRRREREKQKRMEEMLSRLAADLEHSKDPSKFSRFDELHMDNLLAGKDKFKTLRAIRSGNTRERIQQFENM